MVKKQEVEKEIALDKDPVMGISDWELEEVDENDADPETVEKMGFGFDNEYDGFDAYDND
ncbi:MAG: hypothetical protein ABIH39_07645 [Candidatus Margulisiibacteriota bacterium]